MKIVVLGSGTSHGIPVVGCRCPVCVSGDPRDKRMRASIYIEGSGGEAALIDAGPEFRLQAVRAGISRLDGIFLTHSHADHIHGLDDVRPLSREKPLPIYGNGQTIAEMKERFSYVWGTTQRGGGKPRLEPQTVEGQAQIGGLTFTPVPVKHGVLDILGWEVEEKTSPREAIAPEKSGSFPEKAPASDAREGAAKRFLYLTDTSAIPEETLARFGGAAERLVIIGGLRIRPHETHFNFEQALRAALGLGAKAAYLTHICHDCAHAEIEEFCRNFRQSLQKNGEFGELELHPAWDGLELTI